MLFEHEIKNNKKACNYFIFVVDTNKKKRKRNSAKIHTLRALIDGRLGGGGGVWGCIPFSGSYSFKWKPLFLLISCIQISPNRNWLIFICANCRSSILK